MNWARLKSDFVPISVSPILISSSSNIPAAAITNDNLISNGDQHNDVTKRLSPPQHISITTESTKYAQTRYPFPPFIIKFITGTVLPKQVKEELLVHCNNVFQTEINILNCRLSNIRTKNDYDILLFSDQVIPPQFSLIVKNVDLHLDFDDFCS
ncbi:unnamed protein product [Rotaria magnacalcarata]|nr:unnamed protein product [Rotaria magnacalcarata]